MKIGIIGMTTPGLSAAACLAQRGYETFLYCPDDEEVEAYLEGHLPVYERHLYEAIKQTHEQKTLSFCPRVEPLFSCELILVASHLIPDEDMEKAMRFVLQDLRALSAEPEREAKIAVLTVLPPGGWDYLFEQLPETANKFAYLPCPALPGQIYSWFRRPNPALIGTEDTSLSGMLREMLKKLGAPKKRIVASDIKMVEKALLLYLAFDEIRQYYVDRAQAEGIEDIFLSLIKNLPLGKAVLRAPRELFELWGDQQRDLPVLASEQEMSFYHNSLIDGIVDQVLEKIGEQNPEDIHLVLSGISQYAGSSDMRRAPVIELIKKLFDLGVNIRLYMPEGYEDLKWRIRDCLSHVTFCKRIGEAFDQADIVILLGMTGTGVNSKKIAGKIKENALIIDPFKGITQA